MIMAIHQHDPQQTNSSFSLDSLYCKEEQEQQHWDDENYDDELEKDPEITKNYRLAPPISPLFLSEQDLYWDEEELISLLSKEQESPRILCFETEHLLCLARKEAVDWILKVKAHYGFSCHTAILAINYVDRFISTVHFQKDKPWMIQLVAVTCLSLAAKVEETQVPLLVDLQVEETKYVFEAKTIQRMEIIVMSALEWRMNPVTPLSFLDHITRRLRGLTNLHYQFLTKSETLLLSAVSDSRFVGYLPSVLASAAMIHVINQIEPFDSVVEYENQLMGVFKTNKEEKVKECYKLMGELSKATNLKRKHEEIRGAVDSSFSCRNSYALTTTTTTTTSSPTNNTLFKKFKAQHYHHHSSFKPQSPTISFSL